MHLNRPDLDSNLGSPFIWIPVSSLTPIIGVLSSVAQSCLTLSDSTDCSPPGSFVHGDSPGTNTRVGCHALLQGIFLTQGSNPGLPHCRQILYHLSHQGSPPIIYIRLLIRLLRQTDSLNFHPQQKPNEGFITPILQMRRLRLRGERVCLEPYTQPAVDSGFSCWS